MICDSCTQPMAPVYGQQHFHCAQCDKYTFDESVFDVESIESLGKTTGFQCPRCFHTLEVGRIQEQTQVCYCTNCLGFVIDNESLGQLVAELRMNYEGEDDKPSPIDPQQLEKHEACPACLEKMDVHPYFGPGSIVIDTCLTCRLAWLDHGELGRIVRAPGVRPQKGF